MPCIPNQQKLAALKTLTRQFDRAFEQKDAPTAKKLRAEMTALARELQGELQVELLAYSAHKEELTLHEKAGFLETLSDGRKGLRDIFGGEHSFPTIEEVLSRLETKRALIARKLLEYDRPRLLIVPFGLSLPALAKKWKETLVQYKDTLHNEDGSPETVKTDMTGKPYENTNSPVWVWKEYETAEKSGALVYDPQELSPNHQGKTKQEKLADIGGYSIILIDDRTDLPSEGEATTKNGRHTPEANRTPQNYLQMLQTEPQYDGEGGYYPEETLYLYIRNLIQSNGLVTDNWQKKGKATYSLGAYFKASARAPSSGWNSGGSRGGLGGGGVSARVSGRSVRFRVGV